VILRLIAKVIAVMNSNTRSFQVGAAVAFGLLLGLLPSNNLIFAVVLVVLFLVRVHLGIAIITAVGFSLLAPAFDPLLNRLGAWLLSLPALQVTYSRLYEMPIVPWTHFNNTLVAGSLVAGLVLWLPVAFLSVGIVILYRKYIHARIVNSKLVKAIMATPFAQRVAGAVRSVRAVWPQVG